MKIYRQPILSATGSEDIACVGPGTGEVNPSFGKGTLKYYRPGLFDPDKIGTANNSGMLDNFHLNLLNFPFV